MIRFSIITPSYNQAQFIGRTIDSILGQQGNFELDYLVLDGASTDGTVEILKRYGSRIRWVSEPDGGQVQAINRGLREATGDIVAWVNSDDVLLPGALAAVADAFQQRPDALWLHGSCEVIDANDRPIRRWISRYKDYRARRHSFANLAQENYISQMTVFWRREMMEKVGVLDDSLKLAFDYDLWLRMSKVSDPIYLPQRIACFRWYDTSKSGAQYVRQFEEDQRISRRHLPPELAHILWRKRIKNVGIVSTYRLMAVLRNWRPHR